MKSLNSTIVYTALILLILLPPRASSEDRWWEVKAADRRFTYESFAETIMSVQKHLLAFRDFTAFLLENSDSPGVVDFNRISAEQEISVEFKGKDLARYRSSLSWEQQNIGFPNSLVVVEGYGRISRTEILRLKVENLSLKGAPQAEVDSVRVALSVAESDLQEFLSQRIWTD